MPLYVDAAKAGGFQSQARFCRNGPQVRGDGGVARALRKHGMFVAVTVFLNIWDVAANPLGIFNIGFQELLCSLQGGQFLLRTLCGRKIPAVSAQGNIRHDERRQKNDDPAFLKCEFATHQALTYSTVSSTCKRSGPDAPSSVSLTKVTSTGEK